MAIEYGVPERGITDNILGYAENATVTTWHGSTYQDVTDLSITFPSRGRAFWLESSFPVVLNNSGVAGVVAISVCDTAGTDYVLGGGFLTTVANARVKSDGARRIPAVAAGTQLTFKTRIIGPANSSYSIAGTTAQPAYLVAYE